MPNEKEQSAGVSSDWSTEASTPVTPAALDFSHLGAVTHIGPVDWSTEEAAPSFKHLGAITHVPAVQQKGVTGSWTPAPVSASAPAPAPSPDREAKAEVKPKVPEDWVNTALKRVSTALEHIVPLSKEASFLQSQIEKTPAGREATKFAQEQLRHPEYFYMGGTEFGPEGGTFKPGELPKAAKEVLNHIKKTGGEATRDIVARVIEHPTWKLVDKPLSGITGNYSVDWKKVSHYAKEATPAPPVVLDATGNIIDGQHRVYAALARDEKTIPAYVPAEQAARPASPDFSHLGAITRIPATSTLPPQPRLPDEGTWAAIKTDDGGIYYDAKPELQRTHIQLAKDLGIPANRIVSGGWLKDGEYEGSERSDAGRYGERARAQAAAQEKRVARIPAAEAKPENPLHDAAIKLFGTTDDWRETGYVLPDGRAVSAPTYGHGRVAQLEGISQRNAIQDFLSKSQAIRVTPVGKSLGVQFDAEHPPTEKQIQWIYDTLTGIGKGDNSLSFDASSTEHPYLGLAEQEDIRSIQQVRSLVDKAVEAARAAKERKVSQRYGEKGSIGYVEPKEKPPAPATLSGADYARRQELQATKLGIPITEMDSEDAKNWIGYTGQKTFTVYRGSDVDRPIQRGDFVSTSREAAENYGPIVKSQEVPVEHLKYVRGHVNGDAWRVGEGGQVELIYAPPKPRKGSTGQKTAGKE